MSALDARRLVRLCQRRCLSGRLGTLTHVDTRTPVAALTFDDGPDPTTTPRLLDILARHRARATFFMLGEAAERHPDLVRAVAQAGHAIGNHSWDHPSFALIGRGERRAQIRRCARALGPHGAALFRPPFGHQTIASRIDTALLGYQTVTWNAVGRDWLDIGIARMTEDLLAQVRPGSIVLLHDRLSDGGYSEGAHEDRADMLAAVSNVLGALAGTMRFVTVPELVRHGRPRRAPWLVSPSPAFAERIRRRRSETAATRR